MTISVTEKDRRRFLARVELTDGCWLWSGNDNGSYGVFFLAGRMWLAHRVAWLLAHGEWPALNVCHSCDVPKCVRVDHLFLGTQADNMRDMKNKGRARGGNRNPATNGRAVVNFEIAAEARSLRQGGATLSAIAERFKISVSQTHRIVTGTSWRTP